jgi:RRXRR protein/HNH endonuclease
MGHLKRKSMYFIIDGRNNIQHPTKKHDMISRWIKKGKAKFVGKNLVQVFKTFEKSKTINCKFIVGIDPGYKHIGYSIFKIFGNKLQNILNGEVITRTSEITKLIQERKMYRRLRRTHHRKKILRKFGHAKFKSPIWKNRRKQSWNHTHRHLIQSHLNVLNFIFKRISLSESDIALEYFKFDSQKALNPSIKNLENSKGPQFESENTKAYVRDRDKFTCQLCGDKNVKLQVHHIQERSKGGSDRPYNLITLCKSCHKQIHINQSLCPKVSKLILLKGSGVLNSCMKFITQVVSPLHTITGADTSAFRRYYNLEKSHIIDAKMVVLAKLDLKDFECKDTSDISNLKQYRRHTRSWVARYEDRKYVCCGTTVAWNRQSRTDQDSNKSSLMEFKQEYPDEILTIKPGRTTYFKGNKLAKFRPGDIFKTQGIPYVLQQWASTQNTITSESRIKFKTKDCVKIKNRAGMVIT